MINSPVLLSGAHQGSTGIVGDLMDVVRVPVEISDAAIVLPGIEHDQIKQGADLEVSPDAKVIVHLDLADRHPFEVSSHSVHLALIGGNTAVHDERGFSVVQLRGSVTVGVVRYLMIVPHRNPRVSRMTELKIGIRAISRMSLSVVLKGVDDRLWLWNAINASSITIVSITSVFVDVVSKMNNKVYAVLAC